MNDNDSCALLCLSICLHVFLSVCLSVCLSVSVSLSILYRFKSSNRYVCSVMTMTAVFCCVTQISHRPSPHICFVPIITNTCLTTLVFSALGPSLSQSVCCTVRLYISVTHIHTHAHINIYRFSHTNKSKPSFSHLFCHYHNTHTLLSQSWYVALCPSLYLSLCV